VLATPKNKVRKESVMPPEGYDVALLQPSFIEDSVDFCSLFNRVTTYVNDPVNFRSPMDAHVSRKRKLSEPNTIEPPAKKVKASEVLARKKV
jgi:hypothetical protein